MSGTPPVSPTKQKRWQKAKPSENRLGSQLGKQNLHNDGEQPNGSLLGAHHLERQNSRRDYRTWAITRHVLVNLTFQKGSRKVSASYPPSVTGEHRNRDQTWYANIGGMYRFLSLSEGSRNITSTKRGGGSRPSVLGWVGVGIIGNNISIS